MVRISRNGLHNSLCKRMLVAASSDVTCIQPGFCFVSFVTACSSSSNATLNKFDKRAALPLATTVFLFNVHALHESLPIERAARGPQARSTRMLSHFTSAKAERTKHHGIKLFLRRVL